LPPGLPATFYREAARIAAERNVRLVLDSSGAALAAALEEGVFLVKPNLRELAEFTGRSLDRPSDWEAAAAELVDSDAAEVVALSLGHRGAMLVTRELRLYAPPVPVKVESAVGAGDSFLGAMLWKLSGGAEMAEAFRYGVAGGTAALLTPGTELCWPEDVERLSGEVRLQDPGSALLG
jgi:6-phosphofructokinase 2